MATKNAPVKTTKTAAATRKPASVRVPRRTTGSASPAKPQNEMAVGYIPDPSVAERYVNREIYGRHDFDVLDEATAKKKNVLLIGDTGAGKTLLGEAYASARGKRFLAIPCDVSIDPTSIIGKMMPTDKAGEFVWQDGPLTDIFRHGGVVVIDELTFATPKMAASFYSALDSRRHLVLLGHKGEIVQAHPDVLIIATGNLGSAYRGTQDLNAALKNRFKIKVNWGYDNDVEASLVKFPTMRQIASQIRALVGVEIMTPVSTNMLMEFEEFALDPAFGLDFAVGNFVAAFANTEGKSVKEVMDLNIDALRRDLAYISGESTGDEDDFEEFEMDGTFEVSE